MEYLTVNFSLHKKWNFLLRTSSVNVTKSAGNCGFGYIYWRNPKWKASFFVQCLTYFFNFSSTCYIWTKNMLRTCMCYFGDTFRIVMQMGVVVLSLFSQARNFLVKLFKKRSTKNAWHRCGYKKFRFVYIVRV